MTVSTAADHEDAPGLDPAECTHPNPEGELDHVGSGAVEVVAYCPDCETRFYRYLQLDHMGVQP